MAATGKTLQEGATLSHGAAALVGLRSRVRGETLLICFIGLPIDEAWMMLGDENLPLGTRQESNPLLARAGTIQNRLLARFAIARELNPMVRGWIAYYGQYTRSALYPLARYINQTLAIWLKRKYKRFHHRLGRARLFLEKIARENRRLFVHWQLGDGGKLA